jgi:hypothetical protein
MLPNLCELELHGNASDHADSEVDGENPSPEARCVVVQLIFLNRATALENYDQQGQAHRQLRKQVMKRDRKGEVQPSVEFTSTDTSGMRVCEGVLVLLITAIETSEVLLDDDIERTC